MISFRSLCAAVAACVSCVGLPAHAATFATFSAVGTDPNIRWVQQGTSGGELFSTAGGATGSAGAADVSFSFLEPLLASLGPLQARSTIVATTAPGNAAAAFGGLYAQPLTSGSISFVYSGTADLSVNGATLRTGANILTATFDNSILWGSGTSGGVSGSTSIGGGITYSSDFVTFSSEGARDLAINLTSIAPALFAQTGQSLRSFSATAGGAFSTDVAPIVVTPPAAVPEPQSWALLIAGFGIVGAALRRRRPVLATITA